MLSASPTSPNQPNLHPPQRTQNNISPKPNLPPLRPTPLLHPPIRLTHPRNRIPHLSQRKVLPETDPRAAVERDVGPGDGGPGCPAVGIKVVYGWAEEVFAALHYEGAVAAGGVFGDGDGLPGKQFSVSSGGVWRGRGVGGGVRLDRGARRRGEEKYLSARSGR
jgi:hypothetical protein